MRLCQQANQAPFRCAVIPFMSNSNASGFIDTGQFLGDDKVFVSFEGAVEIAKTIGWQGPSARRAAEQENAALRAELDQVKADLAEAERQIEAIDFLGSKDFITRQKRGPKKKEPTTAKAA